MNKTTHTVYFFDVYDTRNDKTIFATVNRIHSVEIKTNGHQKRVTKMTKITSSLSVGGVSKVVTNAFRPSSIYIV